MKTLWTLLLLAVLATQASALCMDIYPQGYVADSGVTAATNVDVAATSSAPSRREISFLNTGTPYAAFHIFAPGTEWAGAVAPNGFFLTVRGYTSDTVTSNAIKIGVSCEANTVGAAIAGISGHDAGTTANVVVAQPNAVTLTTLEQSALSSSPVWDANTGANCTGGTCQNKELICSMFRDNSVGSNSPQPFHLTSWLFCY